MAKQAHQVGDESFCRSMQEKGLELSHLTPCGTSQCPVLRRDNSQSAHILQQTQCKSNSWLYLCLLPLTLNLRPLTPGSTSQVASVLG